MSLGAIIISTFCFILSTFPELQDAEEDAEEWERYKRNRKKTLESSNHTSLTVSSLLLGGDEEPIIDFVQMKAILKIIDIVTVCYFGVEYVVRFICSPVKFKFFFQVSVSAFRLGCNWSQFGRRVMR